MYTKDLRSGAPDLCEMLVMDDGYEVLGTFNYRKSKHATEAEIPCLSQPHFLPRIA